MQILEKNEPIPYVYNKRYGNGRAKKLFGVLTHYDGKFGDSYQNKQYSNYGETFMLDPKTDFVGNNAPQMIVIFYTTEFISAANCEVQLEIIKTSETYLQKYGTRLTEIFSYMLLREKYIENYFTVKKLFLNGYLLPKNYLESSVANSPNKTLSLARPEKEIQETNAIEKSKLFLTAQERENKTSLTAQEKENKTNLLEKNPILLLETQEKDIKITAQLVPYVDQRNEVALYKPLKEFGSTNQILQGIPKTQTNNFMNMNEKSVITHTFSFHGKTYNSTFAKTCYWDEYGIPRAKIQEISKNNDKK